MASTLTNKVIKDGNKVTIEIIYKGEPWALYVTEKQYKAILESGIDTIGIYPYKGEFIARARGIVDGKKVQPMIHKILGLELKAVDPDDPLNFFNEDHVKSEPVIVADKPEHKEPKQPQIHEEPVSGQSAEPIRGVSWNKRKGIYEAKGTYPKHKDRRFLGYYKPEHVHVANEAVRRWISEGPAAYDEIMDTYYELYPDKEKYRR